MAESAFIQEWPEDKLTVAELRAIVWVASGDNDGPLADEYAHWVSGYRKLQAALDKAAGEGEKEPHQFSDWERGSEYICQEGTGFWQRLREEHNWSREDVERLTDYQVVHERQQMFEERPGMPDLDEVEALATLYDTSPGALINRCYVDMGRKLREEEER